MTSRQQLIESVLAYDFYYGYLAEYNSQSSERKQPTLEELAEKGGKEEPAGEPKQRKQGRTEKAAESGEEVLEYVRYSDNSSDINIVYVTIPDERNRERKKDRRQEKPTRNDPRNSNRSRYKKPKRRDYRHSDERSPDQDIGVQGSQQQTQHQQYQPYEQQGGYAPMHSNMGTSGQNRYMQPMAPNSHQQQVMGMPPHMQGMPPNAHMGGMRGYPGYLPQYMGNQQSTFHRNSVYPQMNYYYQMQNYQQNMMMAGQQHQQQQQSPKQHYMNQKMPGQYMMPPPHPMQQQHFQQQHQPQVNHRQYLYEQVKTEVRKHLADLENKEEVLRTLLSLLDKKDSEEELQKLEHYLNDDPTKKALNEITKLLKMEDVLLKVKERRLVNRLMNEPTIPPPVQQPVVVQQRKDPRLRE